MMKVIKLIFAVLFGLFGLMHCVYLPMLIYHNSYVSEILASFAGLCIGIAVSYSLFRSALKKKVESE
jgi:hypothetical protein